MIIVMVVLKVSLIVCGNGWINYDTGQVRSGDLKGNENFKIPIYVSIYLWTHSSKSSSS